VSERSARRRLRMVEEQLRTRGLGDERVLAALGDLPRERFVPPAVRWEAYDDGPLPIGHGQTISQPYVVALMAEVVEPAATDRALEIGTGSGYGAAVLGRLVAGVVTVERIHELAETARASLAAVGATNVTVVEGDGSLGCPERAPFDVIVVTAGSPSVPDALLEQLAEGGRLVAPVGPQAHQDLVLVRRRDETFTTTHLGEVRFVPLLGEQGHPGGS
jgi:protein-L-isoaspartate(D-aspartate) O-methyltransferase